MHLHGLETLADTPFALLDHGRVASNASRLLRRAEELGTKFRLHVKTAKSIEVANLVFGGGPGPITVSTLAEAEAFAEAGYSDIIYAVGIAPRKLHRVVQLLSRGVDISVVVDNPRQLEAVAEVSERAPRIPILLEIDCDGHRGGVRPDSADLLLLARMASGAGELRGVLTHAGESYSSRNAAELRAAAAQERDAAVAAAERIRSAGLKCPVVSVGSTPTAHAVESLEGVTELRAGNFVFFDLFMANLGICTIEDIALSVVVTVIGHQADRGLTLVDGGWMAMSRDRGTAAQATDYGYGAVLNLSGTPIPGLIMSEVTQEHGILSARPGATPAHIPVGTRLRILPNHACATAAQHHEYVVNRMRQVAPSSTADTRWVRVSGW